MLRTFASAVSLVTLVGVVGSYVPHMTLNCCKTSGCKQMWKRLAHRRTKKSYRIYYNINMYICFFFPRKLSFNHSFNHTWHYSYLSLLYLFLFLHIYMYKIFSIFYLLLEMYCHLMKLWISYVYSCLILYKNLSKIRKSRISKNTTVHEWFALNDNLLLRNGRKSRRCRHTHMICDAHDTRGS